MHIVPSHSPILLSSVSLSPIPHKEETAPENEASVLGESNKNFKEHSLDLFKIKVAHLRTIVNDDELPYFSEDGSQIYISVPMIPLFMQIAIMDSL